MKKIAITLILLANLAGADLIPRQDYESDCSKPSQRKALVFLEGGSANLGWTFKQGTTAKDLTGATLTTFSYTPSDAAWSQVVTGALDVATNGSVLITFTPDQLATNSTDLGGLMDWIIKVSDGSDTLAYAYGKLNLVKDPTSGLTNNFPTATTTVDWSYVAAYENTADSGPYRAGTGITFGTANSDGSVPIQVTDQAVTITNLTAGTDITISGSGHTRTIAHTDLSDQASVDNSGGTVIQDVALTNGHVTSLTSYDLDGRYYTETEIDTRVGAIESETNNWNTAYGWGDWSTRVGAIETQTNNWNTAYGWGDHGTAGYAYETNTLTGAVDSYLWTTGRVHKVKLGEDIDAYIASSAVQDGDVLKLPAGEFTVTDDVDVTKSVAIVGQGRGKTTIYCATDNKNVLHITHSDVLIEGLTVSVNASGTIGVYAQGVAALYSITGVDIRNCSFVNASHAGAQDAIYYFDAGGVLSDLSIAVTSANSTAIGVRGYVDGNATTDQTVTIENVRITSSGSSTAWAIMHDAPAVKKLYINIHRSYLVGDDYGVAYTTDSGDITMYGGLASGGTFDVMGTATLSGVVLVNGTTSGTITKSGTIVADSIDLSGSTLKMDGVSVLEYATGTVTVPTNFSATSVTGTTVYATHLGGTAAADYTTDAETTAATGAVYSAAASGWAAADVTATSGVYSAAAAGWAAADTTATGAVYSAAASGWAAADVLATGGVYTAAASGWAAADVLATNGLWLSTTSHVASTYVPLTRTVTVNGVSGSLSSNLAFTVSGGGGMSATNLAYTNVMTLTSAAIQGANDYLASTYGAGRINLTRGTYVMAAEGINVSNNIEIVGSGWGTILDSTGQAQTDFVIDVAGSNVVLQNFQILSEQGATANGQIDIQAGGDFCLLDNLCLYKSDGDAVYVAESVTGLRAKDLYIYDAQNDGIDDDGADESIYTDCIVDDAGGDGISMTGTTESTAKSCVVKNCTGDGVEAGTSCRVLDCLISSCNVGVRGNANSIITGNRISSCNQHGIRIADAWVVCSGNRINESGNGYNDVEVVNSTGAIIVNNTITSSGGQSENGVHLDNADKCVISHNTMASHDTCGISIDVDCDGNLVSGNNTKGETNPIINNQPTAPDSYQVGRNIYSDNSGDAHDATADGMHDDRYNGDPLIGLNAGENITQWDVVYVSSSDGEYHQADADAAGEFPARGFAVSAGTDGNPLTIIDKGVIRNDGWDWLASSVGKTVYLSDTAGGISTNAPSDSGDCVQVLGWILSDDEIRVDVDVTWLENE